MFKATTPQPERREDKVELSQQEPDSTRGASMGQIILLCPQMGGPEFDERSLTAR